MTVNPDPERKGVRPIALTIFCCLGLVSVPLMMAQHGNAFNRLRQSSIHPEHLQQWFLPLLFAMTAGYVGLWLMRKWGLWLFLAAALGFGWYTFQSARNEIAFREQVVREAAGERRVTDRPSAFLDDPDYIRWLHGGRDPMDLPEERRVDPRRQLIEASPRGPWMSFAFSNFKSLCVLFVAFLARRRMR